MLITLEHLDEWDATKELYEWFAGHFPNGDIEYQYLLNTLAAEDYPGYANWVTDRAGPDYRGIIATTSGVCGKHLFAAGYVSIIGEINIKGHLRAGRSIIVSEDIVVAGTIQSGGGVVAGGANKGRMENNSRGKYQSKKFYQSGK